MKINKLSMFYSVLSGLTITTNPVLSVCLLGAACVNKIVDDHRERKANEIAHGLMEQMLRDNHPGLRRIVGDELMDEGRSLLEKKE